MTVDAIRGPKVNRRKLTETWLTSAGRGMVVVPNLAMSNRPKLYISNGYHTSPDLRELDPSSPAHRIHNGDGAYIPGHDSRSLTRRIHIDSWSPSAVKLSFFFGTDPDPDPRGTSRGMSRSVTDLTGRDRGVPLAISDPRGCDRGVSVSVSDDDQEYVTLDYSYTPRNNCHTPQNNCYSGSRLINSQPPRHGPRAHQSQGYGLERVRNYSEESPRNSFGQAGYGSRGSFNPGYIPQENFDKGILHIRQNRPVYCRHISMENESQTGSNRRRNGTLKTVAENIEVPFSPRGVGAAQGIKKKNAKVKRKIKKSKSLPDLQIGEDEGSSVCNYSDDEDGDDFGFLKPHSSFTTDMHKAKSPSPGHTILPKRWRSKTKAITSATSSSLWSPEGMCTWCSMSGRKVVLRLTSLLHLGEAERIALQKVALPKLQAMDMGCPVVIPKENTEVRRSKKHATLSLKRRSRSANIGGLLDTLAEKNKEKDSKDCQPMGMVFGIPLSKCIANDKELHRGRSTSSSTLKSRSESTDMLLSPNEPRKSSSSSQSSLENIPHNGSMASYNPSYQRTASSDSLSESESSRNTSSSLIDALSLSLSRPASWQGSLRAGNQADFATGVPQVPHIVSVCFKHIETYGLRVLGIFRVGSSKKRVKQLRDEFDCGKDVKLNESHNPHDVGALLKEYFRDLPDPLLTRDLYQAFISTGKIKDHKKRLHALRLLVSLLPLPSRDTLCALLSFLWRVVQHSTDDVNENGEHLPGNKMDSHNLATLFGPNILRKAKTSPEKEFLVESTERAEQSKEIIEVVKQMIDSHVEIYEISPELHDEILHFLMETNPEAADTVLKQLANDTIIEPDPDTSSSVFEDSDSPSLPHSPCSDADLLAHSRRFVMPHPPLRVTKSADLCSPAGHRKPIIQIDDRRTASSSDDRPKAHLSIERTPSPKPPRSPRTSRTPRLKVSRDSSSPEVSLRPHPDLRDRPYSEGYSHSLTIPKPSYMRENSSSSVSSYLSSTNSPAGSDTSIQWTSQTPPGSNTNSPRPVRRSSSRHRPLDFNAAEEDAPVGSAEWQRERWRHWQMIAAEKAGETYEQETLV